MCRCSRRFLPRRAPLQRRPEKVPAREGSSQKREPGKVQPEKVPGTDLPCPHRLHPRHLQLIANRAGCRFLDVSMPRYRRTSPGCHWLRQCFRESRAIGGQAWTAMNPIPPFCRSGGSLWSSVRKSGDSISARRNRRSIGKVGSLTFAEVIRELLPISSI